LGENPALCEAYRDQNQSAHSVLLVAKSATDFRDNQEMEDNKKWSRVSARIDNAAKFWIPLAFVVALVVMLIESGTLK
jgi:hypothetical protein